MRMTSLPAAWAERLMASPVASAIAEDVLRNSRREDSVACIDFEFTFMSSSFSYRIPGSAHMPLQVTTKSAVGSGAIWSPPTG